MELALGILLDELADFHPVVHKTLSTKTAFEQIQYYDAQNLQTKPSFLYLAESASISASLSQYCPKHLLIFGSNVPLPCLEHAETVIRIQDQVRPEQLFQTVMNIFVSYENWNQSMLLAIIQHKSISEFLEIAAQKLTNPIALLDNSLTMIAKAGYFTKPYTGTIWEKIESLGHAPPEFFTLQEQRELSKMSTTLRAPYVYHLNIDKEHTYATSNIWIGDKLYGNLGLVDINSPFSDGQLSIIHHITECLKLYFHNNDLYMQIAENDTNFLKNLLKGVSIDEKIVSYHLRRLNWMIHGDFYLLNFTCPLPLDSPIESISYLKRMNQCFHKSLITIYENSIILILRKQDYPMMDSEEKRKLEQLLDNNEMKCGVSTCFPDFMQLKYYYVQSTFAVEYCNRHADGNLQHYEDCHKEHIMQLLHNTTDLRCFCHPQILAMWNSQVESNHELIRCLYHFLINGRNLAMTSKAMYLHRNTLIYRINKISRMLEMNLNNLSSNELFCLLFSCTLVEYL